MKKLFLVLLTFTGVYSVSRRGKVVFFQSLVEEIRRRPNVPENIQDAVNNGKVAAKDIIPFLRFKQLAQMNPDDVRSSLESELSIPDSELNRYFRRVYKPNVCVRVRRLCKCLASCMFS